MSDYTAEPQPVYFNGEMIGHFTPAGSTAGKRIANRGLFDDEFAPSAAAAVDAGQKLAGGVDEALKSAKREATDILEAITLLQESLDDIDAAIQEFQETTE